MVRSFIPTTGIFYGISYVTLRISPASYETASVTVSTYTYDYEKPDNWLPIMVGLPGALRFTLEFRLELRLQQILFCIRYLTAPSSTNWNYVYVLRVYSSFTTPYGMDYSQYTRADLDNLTAARGLDSTGARGSQSAPSRLSSPTGGEG